MVLLSSLSFSPLFNVLLSCDADGESSNNLLNRLLVDAKLTYDSAPYNIPIYCPIDFIASSFSISILFEYVTSAFMIEDDEKKILTLLF